jgi:hypothetical protein
MRWEGGVCGGELQESPTNARIKNRRLEKEGGNLLRGIPPKDSQPTNGEQPTDGHATAANESKQSPLFLASPLPENKQFMQRSCGREVADFWQRNLDIRRENP